VGVVVAVAGAFLFGRALRGILEARRVLRLGRSTVATVIAVEETNISVNGRQQFKVRYSFRDERNQPHEGDSGYLGWTDAASWKPGQSVAIRYDPDRPNESVWIGKPEPTARPAKITDAPPPTSAPPT
jgi:Protein of unknown function (DUF3592)